MSSHLLDSVGPVFLLVLVGYSISKVRLFDADTIDALMRYAVRFAIPCLLFRAVSTLDLGAAYDPRVMAAFYVAAFACFASGTFAAWRGFGRRPGEAVAVGFSALFSNLVLLGLPIVEVALGERALPTAYAIVSVHAPFCYFTGIVAMELFRADGRSLPATSKVVARSMFGNNLMIGIALGFAVNFSGLPVPGTVATALSMIADSALPIALLGLGGVLARYRLTDRIGEIGAISAISLLLHPLLAASFCALLGVAGTERQTVVLMAAMAPGVNVYLFADMYGRAQGTAASTVLVATVASTMSVSAWLWVLGA